MDSWIKAGTINVRSGSILVSDPLYLENIRDTSILTCKVPSQDYDVSVLQVHSKKWGHRVAKVRILPSQASVDRTQEIRELPVDFATLITFDPIDLNDNWILVGQRRDGSIVGRDKNEIVELLRKEGYQFRESSEWAIPFEKPVSTDDEQRIQSLIKLKNLRGRLSIRTGNSLDQLSEIMTKSDSFSWWKLPFVDGQKGFAVAFTTGLGDGTYPVLGLYFNQQLVGLEIDFTTKEFKLHGST